MQEIIERLSKIEHGFQHVETEAKNIFQTKKIENILVEADKLLENDIYQARMLAVFLLGYSASEDSSALTILRTRVSRDPNWRVQEILAKSFDHFCNDIGYEKALPTIKDWLSDSNPNICRAVTEGLRIWTNRPYFKSYPQIAIHLISRHKASDSEYLRKSVGNSLRDISKKYKELIDKEISTWDLSEKRICFTFKYVTKTKR
jgi:hypothetical protein